MKNKTLLLCADPVVSIQSRFATNMKSIRYNPIRFDTNNCVCKQKPEVQNQSFHNLSTTRGCVCKQKPDN